MLEILLNLFVAFTKLGVLGYGGGPSMIPLIQEEAVERQAWMTEEDFIDALAMGNALPGPIATKMSFFIGYKVAGVVGGLVALFSLLWTSILLMMVLGIFFLRFKDLPYAQAMLKAVRPVVFALLAYTAYTVLTPSIKSWHTGLIAVVAFVAVAIFNVHPALTILVAAILGLAVYR